MKFRDQRKTNKRLLTNISNTGTSEKSNASFGQVENADFSDIADFISPTFINPCFRYSPKYSEYRKHGC